jgi:Spy/CpxP family protein refolding chaperone
VAEKHKAALETKRDAVHEAHKIMQKAMHDPAVREADLKVLHDNVSQAQFAIVLERRAMMLESEALLTPEQKAQWEKVRKERMERRFGHGRGPGHGKRMGPGAADPSANP